MQSMVERETIAALGTDIGPSAIAGVMALYAAQQKELAAAFPVSASDVAYGADERQKLDVYQPQTGAPSPILVWVHGGGFMRGSKGGSDDWANANGGRFAARAGFLGIVINYRLAPEHGWPAGAQDLASVVAWLKRNAGAYGGDPRHIVLIGTSAGAAHLAGYMKLRPQHADEVSGAVMLSGVYGVTPMTDVRDFSYYGEDTSRHAERIPLEAIVETALPLLVACSEFDPKRFQSEFVGLLQRRLDRHGRLPRSYIASGHNHYSLAYHLGTSDERVLAEIVQFVRSLKERV